MVKTETPLFVRLEADIGTAASIAQALRKHLSNSGEVVVSRAGAGNEFD